MAPLEFEAFLLFLVSMMNQHLSQSWPNQRLNFTTSSLEVFLRTDHAYVFAVHTGAHLDIMTHDSCLLYLLYFTGMCFIHIDN